MGANPAAVPVNPATNKIYVANAGDDTVTVIDGFANHTSTVPRGSQPRRGGGEPCDEQDLRG